MLAKQIIVLSVGEIDQQGLLIVVQLNVKKLSTSVVISDIWLFTFFAEERNERQWGLHFFSLFLFKRDAGLTTKHLTSLIVCVMDCGLHSQNNENDKFFPCIIGKLNSSHYQLRLFCWTWQPYALSAFFLSC